MDASPKRILRTPAFPLHDYLRVSASAEYDENVFKELVNLYMDQLDKLNFRNESPLYLALSKKKVSAANIIYQAADANDISLDFNRMSTAGESMLQMAIESGLPELYQAFLQAGQDNIRRDTAMPGNVSIYEWIRFQVVMGVERNLDLISLLLDLQFPVPRNLNNGGTLVEVLITMLKSLDDRTCESRLPSLRRRTLRALDRLREASEQEGDPNLLLFTAAEGTQNVLHICCEANQPYLLEYFLRTVREKNPQRLDAMLEETNAQGLPPLFVCVYRHNNRFENRTQCFGHLLDYGQDINRFVPHAPLTPLHYCVLLNPDNPNQVQMAVYLIERGASVNIAQGNPLSPLHYALAQRNREFILAAIRTKAFEPNQGIGAYVSRPIRILIVECCSTNTAQMSSADVATVAATCADLARELRNYGCSLQVNDLSNILMFYDNTMGRAVFSNLLELGIEYPSGIMKDHFDVLTVSVMIEGMQYFRLLIKDGASLNVVNKIGSCGESPAHRRHTHSNVAEKYKVFGLGRPSHNSTICDVCARKIHSFGDNQVTTCSFISCDMDICTRCMFFASDTKGGITAVEMAKRKSDPMFVNLITFLQKTTIGQKIVETGLTTLIDILVSAKILEPDMIINLTLQNIRQLGALSCRADIEQLVSCLS